MKVEITYYGYQLEKTSTFYGNKSGHTNHTLVLNRCFEFEYMEAINIIESIFRTHGADILTLNQLEDIKTRFKLEEIE